MKHENPTWYSKKTASPCCRIFWTKQENWKNAYPMKILSIPILPRRLPES